MYVSGYSCRILLVSFWESCRIWIPQWVLLYFRYYLGWWSYGRVTCIKDSMYLIIWIRCIYRYPMQVNDGYFPSKEP